MTSECLNSVKNYIKPKQARGEDIKYPKSLFSSENDDFSHFDEEIKQGQAEILKEDEPDGILKFKKVEIKTDKSGFSYFLDGTEKEKILLYEKSIPFVYGYVSAVILKRTDKKMHSINLEISKENIYLPIKTDEKNPRQKHYFNEDVKKKIKNCENIGTIAKKGKREDFPVYPDEFVQQAHSEIQEKRRVIEKKLTDNWIESKFDDGWLFVDGPLNTMSQKVKESSNIAGIIKSHRTPYFTYEKMYELYSMAKGERSSVFQIIDNSGKKKEVYTWYLRIHTDKRNGVNDFGIIRVEIPTKKELLKKVDEISSWILLETKPVGFPASRWDRMIYPIKYCEDYLKSKAPSWIMIESIK